MKNRYPWRLWLLTGWMAISCGSLPAAPVHSNQPTPHSQPNGDTLIKKILAAYPSYFDTLLRNNKRWRIQIIYTQIDRAANQTPKLTHHYYNVNPAVYFYPASTVKMPIAALALQRLNELAIKGVDKNSTLITSGAAPEQTAVFNDASAPDGRPTIGHYIKKIFAVSDNDAYNRLYEFLGQEYINQSLHKAGLDSVQLLHRLQVTLTEEQNRVTNPVAFYDTAGRVLYTQAAQRAAAVYPARRTLMGNGYLSNDGLVNKPFDFSKKNRISLPDLHGILQRIVFPQTVSAKQRFKLTAEDYAFLYKSMSTLPRESVWPKYDSSYTDAYVKFLLFGGDGPIANSSLRIFNKVGDAYGFLQDVAYVVDFNKGVEFMLSATIYCNQDGIFNDDKYDYDSVGYPFLKHLGEAIYNYEIKRPKKVRPDLARMRFDYSR